MSEKGEFNTWGGRTAWARKEEDNEPIVSFVEIMSEDLADSLNREEERKQKEYLAAVEQSNVEMIYDNDEAMARALQREFDREYEFSMMMNGEKMADKAHATITVTPDRYCPKTTQDSNQSSDDEDMRESAMDLLYAKDNVPTYSGAIFRIAGGNVLTKHDAEISAKRNAEKTMNDKIPLAFGDMLNEQINSRVFNSLRKFSKAEAKRQHKLKDKEEKATIEISMDAASRLHLFKWINQGVFDRVEGIIATGKESAVLHGVSDETGKKFAIKVYKMSLTEFKNRSEYVKDDFRFKNPRQVMKIWAEREFMNLSRMTKCGVPCPTPIKLKRHLLLMSLVEEAGEAAPRLKNIDWDFSTIEDRRSIFLQVQDIMRRMFKDCRLVHGDLSEFNLLLSEGKVYVIDVSQSMDLSHPRNLHYLIRDVENVLAFFRRLDIPDLPTPVALFNTITDLEMNEESSLMVQVEKYCEDNKTAQIHKSKTADFEWSAYDVERKQERGESPAHDYN